MLLALCFLLVVGCIATEPRGKVNCYHVWLPASGHCSQFSQSECAGKVYETDSELKHEGYPDISCTWDEMGNLCTAVGICIYDSQLELWILNEHPNAFGAGSGPKVREGPGTERE